MWRAGNIATYSLSRGQIVKVLLELVKPLLKVLLELVKPLRSNDVRFTPDPARC